jgi:hypothetical protein
VMVFGRYILDQEVPRHGAAFDERLIHGETSELTCGS